MNLFVISVVADLVYKTIEADELPAQTSYHEDYSCFSKTNRSHLVGGGSLNFRPSVHFMWGDALSRSLISDKYDGETAYSYQGGGHKINTPFL